MIVPHHPILSRSDYDFDRSAMGHYPTTNTLSTRYYGLMTEVGREDVHNIMINDIALGYSTDTPWQDLPDRYHRIKDVIMVVSNN
jgi:hypothetical protein